MANEMICISAEDFFETLLRSSDEVLSLARKTLDDTTYNIVVHNISRYEATVAFKLIPDVIKVKDIVLEKLNKEKIKND